MTGKLTYAKKCVALFAGFICLFMIVYKLSFSNTLEVRKQAAEKEKKIAWLKDKEKEIPMLKTKLALVNSLCKDSFSVRDRLTAFISDFADNNGCTVTDIPGAVIYSGKDVTVTTNAFTVKGNFRELLQLENLLENRFNEVARIMSARFFCMKDLQTKRKNLYLTVIAQSFAQK